MNKVKMFFVASALVLTTAGVFAGKAKFIGNTPQNLYYLNSGSYITLSSSPLAGTAWEYGVANGAQLSFKNAASTATYTLFVDDAGVKKPVYAGF